MKVCTTIESLREARQGIGALGFVPTMGYLHEGHLSLVKKAREENDVVVVSIFVNPTQFGPDEDFDSYPRDLERDLAFLRDAGVDLVFAPERQTLYPEDFVTSIAVGGVAEKMEGVLRPGHFSGVATVVTKLFNVVQPQRVYFGQKDAQQCAVIKRIVEDLNFPVSLVIMPTLREADGLARSSRNVRLTQEERAKAPALYKALACADALFRNGERDRVCLEQAMRNVLEEAGLETIDYAMIVVPSSFEAVTPVIEEALALLAVRLGKVRLIDNLPLGK